MTFKEIVEIWNELHESEGLCIIGNPSIDYDNDAYDQSGVVLPGGLVRIKDGTRFNVDPYHNG